MSFESITLVFSFSLRVATSLSLWRAFPLLLGWQSFFVSWHSVSSLYRVHLQYCSQSPSPLNSSPLWRWQTLKGAPSMVHFL